MGTPPDSGLDTAVALLLFRRPEETARVFERIREARPRKLFLIADGPRPGGLAEARPGGLAGVRPGGLGTSFPG